MFIIFFSVFGVQCVLRKKGTKAVPGDQCTIVYLLDTNRYTLGTDMFL